jgi:hypothetical protein
MEEKKILINKTTISQSVKICDTCGLPIAVGDDYNRMKEVYPNGAIVRAVRHYECACAVYAYCTSGQLKERTMSEYSDEDFRRWLSESRYFDVHDAPHLKGYVQALRKRRMTE